MTIADVAPSPPLSGDALLPNHIFIEPAIFDREISLIWESAWIFALHSSEIPTVGDYRLVRVGRRWIIVVRDGSGRVRAYENTCRHRAAPVVTDVAGNARMFRCFYHQWTYNLGGELVGQGAELTGVPELRGYEDTGFRKEDFALHEVHTGEFLGMVFVCLSETPPDFDEYFGEIRSFLNESGHPMASAPLEVFQYHSTTLQSNWKLFSDNNREGYHVYLHWMLRRTAKGLMTARGEGNKWHFCTNGHMYFGNFVEKLSEYSAAGYDDHGESKSRFALPGTREGSNFLFYLFPDVLVNLRSNAIRIDRMTPLSSAETLVEWRHLGLEGDSDDVRSVRADNTNLVWGPLGRNLPEDMLAVEEQWRQMASDPGGVSVIARQDDGNFMDDICLRVFYGELRRRLMLDENWKSEADGS